MAISSPGIGSNLDINGIVAKLMQAEARPLAALAKKEASFQAKVSAFGNLSGTIGSFQNALTKLNTPATFQSSSAVSSDALVASASATSKATPGSYSVNVTKLAQAQTLSSAGVASTNSTIGTGTSAKLLFKFGSIGGNIVNNGSALGASVPSSGVAANSLSINGTTITTSGSTNSAKALATQINLVSATTGVTATAQTTDTGALGAFATSSTSNYRLVVGGVTIIDETAGDPPNTDANAINLKLLDPAVASALSSAGISFSGDATLGSLKFTMADGSNIAVQQSGTSGGFSSVGVGASKTFASSVSLSSSSSITIAGGAPAAAGFTAGTYSTYGGATFTQDANQISGEVTIDNTNNSLQGIRDAINKANLGITASIVSDGSATPYHLVLKSNKTGETSSMKIEVQGAEPALTNLFTYDPAGTQAMTQTSAAQNAALSINGISVTSQTNSIPGAIEGVSLEVSKLGTATINVKRDTAGVQSAVNALVKSYNDLNSTIKKLTSYDPETKQAGVLLGDSSVRTIETQLRKLLSSATTGSNSTLKTLSQVGISISKDGVMSVDSSKLSTAMNTNLTDVAALFSSIGKTTDSLVTFAGSTAASTQGTHNVFITKLATQGKVTGTGALAATTIDATNKDLSLTVDGVTASVSLTTRGTAYSPAELAAHLQSTINSASAFSSVGIAVAVTLGSGGELVVTSNKYGSASKVSVSGTATTALFNTAAPTPTDGIDVEGTIAGVAAGGSGQFLTGASGSPAAGLKLEITGGAVNTNRGTVSFSQGFAFHLNNLVEGFLGNTGVIAGRTDGLKNTIKDIAKTNELMNQRLAGIEKRYRAQFTALDAAISRMSSTSAYLSQQLAQLSNMSSR